MGESVLKRVRVTSRHSTLSFEGRPLASSEVETYAEDPQGCFYVASIVDAEIANLRRCLTATDEQRDEAIAAHNRACKQEQKTFSELCDARAEIARLKAEAAKDAECIHRLADMYVDAMGSDGWSSADADRYLDIAGVRDVNGKWERER